MESTDLENILSSDLAMNSINGSINSVKLVKAKYNFKATNNDELCFNKDDIITLSQWPTGGWWEGTLNGITGWFPSNYVQPLSSADIEMTPFDNLINNVVNNTDSDTQQYRQMVFQDIEDTESVYVKDMCETINKYLKPLQNSQILSESEINTILRAVQEIQSVHNKFLAALKSLNSVPHKEMRIGGVFLEFAPHIKAVHSEYCGNHAKFVHSIEKYKKEISHLFSSLYPTDQSAGNVLLTACLSASFRRLDKYPALLQELQRYTDESHVDRGDTQRAGFVYRELSMFCLELRRRKEMELEVMLGNIKNLDAMNVQSLGEIIRMDSISIQIIPDYSEMKKDRYLVLFPQTILVLSVSTEMTSFVFEAKLKLEDAVIKTNDELMDSTNIFEITNNSDDKNNSQNQTFIIQCPTIEDKKNWFELLQKQILLLQSLKYNISATKSQSTDQNICLSGVRTSNSDCSTTGSNVILNTTQALPMSQTRSRYWMNRCLTPHPPTRIRPIGSVERNTPDKDRQQLTANEDMMLLQVIEGYCNTQRVRQSSASNNSDNSPQVFIIDDSSEKPLTDFIQSSNSFIKTNGESNDSETELSLREEIQRMKIQIQSLCEELKAERRSRKKLKAFLMERKTSAKKTTNS